MKCPNCRQSHPTTEVNVQPEYRYNRRRGRNEFCGVSQTCPACGHTDLAFALSFSDLFKSIIRRVRFAARRLRFRGLGAAR